MQQLFSLLIGYVTAVAPRLCLRYCAIFCNKNNGVSKTDFFFYLWSTYIGSAVYARKQTNEQIDFSY